MFFEKDKAQVRVDLMSQADLPEIMAIERSSFRSPWTQGMFLDEMRTTHAQCLAVKIRKGQKAEIAAYMIFWLVADEGHLHKMAVKMEYRRLGLAASLMNVMKDIAAQMGISRRTLEVRESNDGAIHLYRKCGFVVRGKRPNYYDDTHEAALIMWAEP